MSQSKHSVGSSIQHTSQSAPHVFLSLGDFLQERLFFHPSLLDEREPLGEGDEMALNTILEGRSIDECYDATLAVVIDALDIQPDQRVRFELNSCDSKDLASLIGGDIEAQEQNPLVGLRGVARYTDSNCKKPFIRECEIIKSLRAKGIAIEVVVPFVKSLSDAARVIDALAEQGLPRGLNGLRVLFGADTPSAALLSERLLKYFDGVVVDLEVLAQLTLGVDMSNEHVSQALSLDNEPVLELVSRAFGNAQAANKSHILLLPESAYQSDKIHDLLNDFLSTDVVLKG
ncbi:putative PEP-binding protein [Vibrio gallicus]|uniref:putative PEP-binding protein n=1 Tax=Vibrio gallicus TaxID=190897 RepID=UPI0021C2C0BB|nr:putative PEP-binding protein [Vibrio gallicus]